MSKTRHDEMVEQVEDFHQRNPKVWRLFEKFTFDVISRGFNNYSVNAIFERIRWEQDIVGMAVADTFKLNNNYRAFYARNFMVKFPEHEGFFRTRTQTSAGQEATHLPELPPSYYQHELFTEGVDMA